MPIYDLIDRVSYDTSIIIHTFRQENFFVGKVSDFTKELMDNRTVLNIKIIDNVMHIRIG